MLDESFVETMKSALNLDRILNAAKIIYGFDWPNKKKEALAIINDYRSLKGIETVLAAAIDLSSIMNDPKLILLILAAAVDK